MGLCHVCLGLDFVSIMRTDPSKHYRLHKYKGTFLYTDKSTAIEPAIRPKEPFVSFHKSLDSLNISSKTCELCRLIQPSINTTIELHKSLGLEAQSHSGNNALPTQSPSNELFLCGLTGAQGLQVVWTAERLRVGIPIGFLPPTFQDALWLASQLGVSYVWIDSLCIFQDDPDDWVRESSHMLDVYGNAYLTIAATRAENSLKGFLGSRSRPASTTIPFRASGISSEVSAFVLPLGYTARPSSVIEMVDAPLSKRAWALQERYLSPRTLHFTDSQTYLECDQSFVADDGFLESTIWEGNFSIQLNSTQTNKIQRRESWYDIIERYSRRSLTIEDDKLPALGGLAARFASVATFNAHQSLPDNPYLAGIWKEDLLRSLCWRVDDRYPIGCTPSAYTAPSWSWASVNTAVVYKSAWFRIPEELAIIQGAGVDIESTGNTFGKVTGGWMHLSVIKLRPYHEDKGYLWFREGESIFRITVTWDSARYGLPEYARQVELDAINIEDLVVVPLAWDKGGSLLTGPVFLLMVEAETNASQFKNLSHFQRVGFGWVSLPRGQELDQAGVRILFEERFSSAKGGGMLDNIILI
ncbi:hypothetical protein G7046_g6824 [Stylonectria norvegica]|nr:hypothetical protein G7046_g6824 [Stylonectria norvegica]